MNLGLKMIAIEGRNELAYYDGRRTHCDPLRLANSYAYYSAQNLANQTARAAMTRKAFPETLYVKRENEGANDEYLTTETDIQMLAEVGKALMVAEYRLVRTDKLCTVVNWPTTKK